MDSLKEHFNFYFTIICYGFMVLDGLFEYVVSISDCPIFPPAETSLVPYFLPQAFAIKTDILMFHLF